MWGSNIALQVGLVSGTKLLAWGPRLHLCFDSLTSDVVHWVILGPVVTALAFTKAKLYQAIRGAVWIFKAYSYAIAQCTEPHNWVTAGEGAQQAQTLFGVGEHTPHLHSPVSPYGWKKLGLELSGEGFLDWFQVQESTDLMIRCCYKWTQWQ